jgi:hypothetical protein
LLPGGSYFSLLLADLHLKITGLWQRNDLLHIKNQGTTKTIRLHANATDMEVSFVEPEHCRRHFCAEIRRSKDDMHVFAEMQRSARASLQSPVAISQHHQSDFA